MANLSGYIFLALAILLGITSNGFLKSTNGFTIIGPTIFCIISIVACIFCLSKAMNIIPVGFTYATYGGLTITAVTLFGVFKYQQIPNLYGIIGISLIIINSLIIGLVYTLAVYYSNLSGTLNKFIRNILTKLRF